MRYLVTVTATVPQERREVEERKVKEGICGECRYLRGID